MLMEKDNFDLTALLNIPLFCDGCGSPSTVDHFLICKKPNGLTTQHHNEMRDAIGDFAALVCGLVNRKPIV